MTMLRNIAVLLMVLVFGASCTTDRSYGEAAGIEVTQLGELPVPESPRGYGLRVYDEIVVRV
ncbi:MAG: hypothetical protein WA948_10480, partial [Pontixanthobacter sp.]